MTRLKNFFTISANFGGRCSRELRSFWDCAFALVRRLFISWFWTAALHFDTRKIKASPEKS